MVELLVISPATTMRPVVRRVSQATRDSGSPASAASTTASEIWSAILSGCPSVTDSEVKRNPLLMLCLLGYGSRFVSQNDRYMDYYPAAPLGAARQARTGRDPSQAQLRRAAPLPRAAVRGHRRPPGPAPRRVPARLGQ